ncbi:related to glyoxal oxidase precursor [Phialocephala subalpina]|uniref:Related to glyoxal oxidase n=1 Tax=Phialocephala subalpina TaxID=576137 RepID=A0A1L7X7W4_9HELO|nr:related to glyoxal oxidase precursor [Phialocephala subalpina]
MRFFTQSLLWQAAAFLPRVLGAASYDEYRDADIGQSGYLPNHNMDPNIVNSAAFGLLWKQPFNTNEQFYAKPLTYTPLAGGSQILFLASSQNWIRTLDAKTGALINSRQVHTPFLQSDIGCTDIPNYIGIIGTPTIDPATDIAYFYSKTYIPNYRVSGNTGTSNGVYYFHGVNVNTLADVFTPILMDGAVADNAPAKYFVGGVVLQRPSLLQIGSVVYGAFGASCDLYNYTGLVIGIDVNKAKIVTHWAVESGPLAPQTNSLLQNGGGGEGGIWMSGMGLASDGQRMFLVTGNGGAHENVGAPATGTSGCQTLGEAAVNLGVDSSTGAVSVSDYFQPYDYQNMDGGDQDFGAGGLVLLDSSTFTGGGVSKMAVTAGKNGKVYVLNANNLGGYKLGTGQTDGIIQTITEGGSVFGAAGSYPLEGGYVYTTPVGYATFAYSLGFTSAGVPQLSRAGQTNEVSAGRVGVGVPTVTSLNGQAGSAILWMTDPDAGLRAWYAVPQNGVLVNIPLPAIGGANKFQRPAFGNARVYTTDSNGVLYCLGSPVALPLNCTSPVDFGQLALGSTATKTVTCTALIAITNIVGLQITSTTFQASNASLPTGALAKGASFSFPVTWNLTNSNAANAVNASSPDVQPGIKSTPLTILTNNAVTGYSTSLPISLTGTEVSQNPYLSLSPAILDYGGVVVTGTTTAPTVSSILTIANKGLNPLTINGYAFTANELASNPTWTNSTLVNGSWNLGYGFTASNLPAVGSQIAAGVSIAVDTTFDPINGTGQYLSYFEVWSDGGAISTILEGAASTAPIANFSISNGEGGWLPQSNLIMDFGTVAPGSSSTREIQICNQGGSALTIDKSKPPNGVFHISDPTELHESQAITPGACAYGTVIFTPDTEEYNVPNLSENNTWTLNVNDLTWGVHVVEITGTVVDKFVGPVNSTGQNVYQYLGCYQEATTGPRLFPNEPLATSTNNTNARCQTGCYSATTTQYAFAGTEYGDECWCGNTPPPLASQAADTLCNTACPGDGADRCGATGYLSVYYDPTKYVAGTDPALYGPQTIQSVGPYVYQGCYSEATNGRALSGESPTAPSGGFTIELCEAACVGYTYFGMEYSNQCYCGNTIEAGSVNQTSSVPTTNGCSMTCTGNAKEYCGGSNRLNLYMLNSTTSASTSTSASVSSTSSASKTGTSVSASSSVTGTSSGASSSTSGSSTASSVTSSSASATPTGPITVTNLAGWTYLGCYSEGTNTRALSGLANPIPAASVSVESCAAACSKYTYFGVEYAQECYCGNTINTGSVNQTSSVPSVSGCSMICKNNALEYCGGSNRLNMYQAAAVSSSSSYTVLSSTVSSSSSLSTSSATSSSLSSSSSVVSSSSSMTSSSSSTTASPTLAIKQTIGNYVFAGCYTEGTNVRALSSKEFVNYTAMTLETCASNCAAYTYWGVEYGGECYCGNTLNTGSVLATNQADCSFTCPGNEYEYCGAGNRLEMYKLSASTSSSSSSVVPSTSASSSSVSSSTSSTSSSSTVSSTSSTSSPSSSSTATTTSSSSSLSSTTTTSSTSTSSTGPPLFTGTPKINQTIGSLQYMGCALEVSGRALSGMSYTSSLMTIESCSSFCMQNNYALSGVEYSSQCYCGNGISSASSFGQTGCTMTCSGNTAEYCGGSDRLSVFNNTAYVSPTAPTNSGNYILQGCYQEASAGRLLSGPSTTNSTGMTVEMCTSYCQAQGTNGVYAGVEYAQECYCGASLPSTAVQTSLGSCNMLCKGNTKEYCGGSGLLDVYLYKAPGSKSKRDRKMRIEQ